MDKYNHNPEKLHKELYAKTTRRLAYSPDRDFEAWRAELRLKLAELLGMHKMPDVTATPEIIVTAREEHSDFTEIVFTFESEPGYFAPCHFLIPKRGKAPFPTVVCLQGHNSGMHNSLGRAEYDSDDPVNETFRAYGIQAVAHGYAALVMEQRGFGVSKNAAGPYPDCHGPAMQALMLGRTLYAERVFDIIRAINALSHFPEADMDKIGCMGNSGGGTATYYAACLDERIKIAMPSCSICTLYGSFFSLPFVGTYEGAASSHSCVCCYIPGISEWVENQDLSALIAPRKLLLVNGRGDPYFPIKESIECFEDIKEIYKKAGAEGNCRMVIGEEGHRFYPDEAWPVFKEMAGF